MLYGLSGPITQTSWSTCKVLVHIIENRQMRHEVVSGVEIHHTVRIPYRRCRQPSIHACLSNIQKSTTQFGYPIDGSVGFAVLPDFVIETLLPPLAPWRGTCMVRAPRSHKSSTDHGGNLSWLIFQMTQLLRMIVFPIHLFDFHSFPCTQCTVLSSPTC